MSTAARLPAVSVVAERDRKLEHIELAMDRRIQLDGRFFDTWSFTHEALPEIRLEDIDVGTTFLGKSLQAPLLVSCMTGGTGSATKINRNLAEAAERTGIAIGVGSQRKALESPETAATFEVRAAAPSVPVIGNLGAVQLNYGMGIDHCRHTRSAGDRQGDRLRHRRVDRPRAG